jgi:hypothetical protein
VPQANRAISATLNPALRAHAINASRSSTSGR